MKRRVSQAVALSGRLACGVAILAFCALVPARARASSAGFVSAPATLNPILLDDRPAFAKPGGSRNARVPAPARPTAAPAANPAPRTAEGVRDVLTADAVFDPKAYNEFSPGNTAGADPAGRPGTYGLGNLGFIAEADFRQFGYPHRLSGTASSLGVVPCTGVGAAIGEPGCVTALGPFHGSAFVPSFGARDSDVDGRFGIGVANPRIFVGTSLIARNGDYGYARQSGTGVGVEKLTNYNQPIDIYGSIYYYPEISGDYVDVVGANQKIQYELLHYQAGLNVVVPRTPLFLNFGYLGDKGNDKQSNPSGFSENSFYGGLGIHF